MNNWMLFGVFLLVPVVVHLFSFRRAQKVFFSHTRFIQLLNKSEKSKSKLKYLLILLNRLLAFIGIIILFASSGQVLKNSIDGTAVVYFDKSISNLSSTVEGFFTDFLNELQLSTGSILLVDDFEKENYLPDQTRLMDSYFEPYFTNAPVEDILDDLSGDMVFLFSDFNTWKPKHFLRVLNDTTKRYNLVSTQLVDMGVNTYVDSIYTGQVEGGQKARKLVIEFGTNQAEKRGNILVKLMLGDRQLSSVMVDLSESVSTTFDLALDRVGTFRLELDGDPILFDNDFRFFLGDDQIPVIACVDETPKKYLLNVFNNESLFDVRNLNSENLDFNILKQSDILVLAGLNSVPRGVISQNRDLIFFIFPGPEFDTSGLPFLSRSASGLETGIEVDLDFGSPVFKGIVENSSDGVTMPEAKPFGEFQDDFESLISFRGGQTFLGRNDNVYFFNTTLVDSISNFQSHSLFLPILYQLVFESMQMKEVPYFFPGEYIFIDRRPSDVPFIVKGSNFEAVPEFNTREDGTLVEIPLRTAPGVYQLLQGNDTLKTFCVNVLKSESKAGPWSYKELREYFEGVNHVNVFDVNTMKSEQILHAERDSIPFWKYALLLALAFLLIETMLQRHFK